MRSQTLWVDVPGGRLAVEDEGEGPPILLVHSAIVNRRAWDALTPLLVEAGYRAIRYDMRGWGESTAEAVEYSPRADLLAGMDAPGGWQAAVVRKPLGGMAVLHTPAPAPGWVVALRLVRGG